ncbi:MAG: PDZ domain-containing protein [Dehalococcoidia bacterium]|nr:PDZ domain-containing protein [Dehalococcoidia bacterium]
MSVLQSIVPFVAILVFLIVVHELGHFITAKLAGVKVLEAGLGYPPKAWGKKFGETEYTINWLPLGGFVRLLGEEDPSDPRSLAAKPRWVRLIVLFAGSGMNLLLPILLFAIAFTIPQEVGTGGVTVTYVAPGSPAEEAGLETEDVIVSVAGREIENIDELSRAIQVNLGDSVGFEVLRDGGIVATDVQSRWSPPEGQGPTGISIRQYPFTRTRSEPPWESIPHAVEYTIDSLVLAEKQIEGWFRGTSAPDLAGPVGIADATGEVVEQAGWIRLFEFAALLSINLAIINVLPLPMLDGGRIAFVLLEYLRGGKRVPPEKEGLVHLVGFAVMMGAVVIISYFDILRLIRGESLFG